MKHRKKLAVGHILAFLLWNLAYGAALLWAPRPLGIPLALGATALYLVAVVLPRGWARDARLRAATLRLRPPPAAQWPWIAAAVPVLLVLSATLDIVYGGLVRISPQAYDPLGDLADTSLGRLAVAVAAVGIAPLVEELIFRGLLQRTLERSWGPAWGIGIAAAVFGVAHAILSAFPLYFFLGVAFGFVVFACRSVWAGVVLHAANNAFAYLSLALLPAEGTRETVWETGLTSEWMSALVGLLIAGIAAGWVARGMLRQRANRFRSPAGPDLRGAAAPDVA